MLHRASTSAPALGYELQQRSRTTNTGRRPLTLGSNQALTPRLTNEFRFNYSRSRAHSLFTLDNFGGATPPPDSVLYPSVALAAESQLRILWRLRSVRIRLFTGKFGRQLAAADQRDGQPFPDHRAHTRSKFGLDYRRITPKPGLYAVPVDSTVFLLCRTFWPTRCLRRTSFRRTADVQLRFSNWSLFAQDTWKATRTLTITYGLRWEYNAAPSSPNGTLPFTVTQVNNLRDHDAGSAGHAACGIRKKTISLRGSASPGRRARIWSSGPAPASSTTWDTPAWRTASAHGRTLSKGHSQYCHSR